MAKLSDFEIGKIAEIVAGRVGKDLDAKSLRQVIDRVVDAMAAQPGNPEITGATCEITPPDTMGNPLGPATGVSEAGQDPAGPDAGLPPDEAALSASGGLYEQIEKSDRNRIIIAAFGKDRPGVGAALTGVLAECNCSIEDISQTLMQEYFSMIMIANMAGCTLDFAALREKVQATETRLGMKVYVMHEDIFRFMHRI